MNLYLIIGLAIILEIITYILRFKFDFHSKSIQKKMKLPFRIHHMYIGVAIILFCLLYRISFVFDMGIAVALSDVMHHFIILPIFHKKIDFP